MSEAQPLRGISVVVPAAGRGARMGDGLPKQYLPLNGTPMLQHVLSRFLAWGPRHLVVAVAADDGRFDALPAAACCRKVTGGDNRAASVMNGLDALRLDADDWVMVHDGARPCITADDVMRLVNSVAGDSVGGILAVRVTDTVKRGDEDDRIAATLPRSALWLAQTPQLFRYGLLKRALAEAERAAVAVTDEASAVERLGLAPRLVAGRRDNIKVTTPEDVALAEHYLTLQARR